MDGCHNQWHLNNITYRWVGYGYMYIKLVFKYISVYLCHTHAIRSNSISGKRYVKLAVFVSIISENTSCAPNVWKYQQSNIDIALKLLLPTLGWNHNEASTISQWGFNYFTMRLQLFHNEASTISQWGFNYLTMRLQLFHNEASPISQWGFNYLTMRLQLFHN